MKKRFLSATLVCILIISCNNNSNNGEPLVTTAADQDTVSISTTKPTEPELTAAEMQDDLVVIRGNKSDSWAVAGIKDVKGFKLFLKKFKQWVAADNKEELSKIILYPVARTIDSKQMFIENYDKVFTKDLKSHIKETRLNQVFKNYRGASIADGKIWFGFANNHFWIIAINPEDLTDWGIMPPPKSP